MHTLASISWPIPRGNQSIERPLNKRETDVTKHLILGSPTINRCFHIHAFNLFLYYCDFEQLVIVFMPFRAGTDARYVPASFPDPPPHSCGVSCLHPRSHNQQLQRTMSKSGSRICAASCAARIQYAYQLRLRSDLVRSSQRHYAPQPAAEPDNNTFRRYEVLS